MLAQLKAYKYTILLALFGLMTIGLLYFYFRLDAVKTENKDLTTRLTQVEANYKSYQEGVDKAQADLALLRVDLTSISNDTAALQKRLGQTSKPTTGGSNSKVIEKEANQLSQDVFNRFK